VKIVDFANRKENVSYEIKAYEEVGAEYLLSDAKTNDEIVFAAENAEVILFTATVFDRELLDKLPSVKLLARYGMGYDTVDLAYARKKGIAVCNAPTYGTADVAEHTFALLMAVNRKIPSYHMNIKSGRFGKSAPYDCYRLENKILGIVGFGRIAKKVAQFAKGFNMKVYVYDPFVSSESAGLSGVEKVDFETLMTQSDYISLNAPLTEETRGMFDKTVFGKMKPSSVIVNTARGGLINEKDLADALRENKIRAAAVDVYSVYPKTSDHPFLGLENMVLTPHIAFNSVEAVEALHKEVTENVIRFIKGEPLQNVVN
jgi:D-3-phosphoglycerate dehydrogenase